MQPHETYQGRLELTWTNKQLRLLAHEDGSYQWVPPVDYRVAEVRLLHDVDSVGAVHPAKTRVRDNLLIRGDALNALTSLVELPEFAREYVGKVKLAYLDPPFNTQQAFEHYDDALEHSVWLTMMRDRLLAIKTLLSSDGSVWVHCDDSEQAYLKVMMDEVFGRACFVATVIWRKVDSRRNDAKQFSTDHDYILIYGKQQDWRPNREVRAPEMDAIYSNPDNDPRGPWFGGGDVSSPNPRPNLRYSVTAPNGLVIQPPTNGWRWSSDRMKQMIDEGEICFSDQGTRLFRKRYVADQENIPPSTLWVDLDMTGHNRQAKYELKRLFNQPSAELFGTPKPERLIQQILQGGSGPGDVVLDCFLGSGTTAAVAHKMGRRWIGVEWSADTLDNFTIPRLTKVVEGRDSGGITRAAEWKGGGSFRILEVAPSMFTEDSGRVVLSDWATHRQLAEVTAAQLHFEYHVDGPFSGRQGRSRLAVVDGLVNEDVAHLLVGNLADDESVVICGTAVDPKAQEALQVLRPGSTVRKIPQSLLRQYRRRRRWLTTSSPTPGVEVAA